MNIEELLSYKKISAVFCFKEKIFISFLFILYTMRVVFVNLPWRGRDYAVRAGSRWAHSIKKTKKVVSYRPFPFYMGSAAALLEKDHDVMVIDALAEEIGEEKFFKIIKKVDPEVIVAEIATPSYDNDIWFLKKIKQMTNAMIVVAGQHVAALPFEVERENPFIDYILVGEYEFLLKDLLSKKKKPKDKIIRLGKLPDIDKIPWPAKHMFKMELYNEPFCRDYPNMQMLASRGCYFRCSYCNIFNMYGGRNYRFRDPKDIVDEIEDSVNTYKSKEIYFDDDLVNGKPKELEKMCDIKVKRKIDVPFSAMAHSMVSRETLKKMKKAGCVSLKFGVESADDHVLKLLGKGINIKMVNKAVKNCKELGIKTHLTYAIGLPGDTEETIKKTIKYAMNNGDSYQISMSTPYPGTPLYNMAKLNGWLRYNSWSDFDGATKAIVDYPELRAVDIYKYFKIGQQSVYWKYIQTGEYRNLIKMAYQEGGLPNLARLFFVRGPGIARAIVKSSNSLK